MTADDICTQILGFPVDKRRRTNPMVAVATRVKEHLATMKPAEVSVFNWHEFSYNIMKDMPQPRVRKGAVAKKSDNLGFNMHASQVQPEFNETPPPVAPVPKSRLRLNNTRPQPLTSEQIVLETPFALRQVYGSTTNGGTA